MAIAGNESTDTEAQQLLPNDIVSGSVVDYKGLPVLRSTSGGWRSAAFIIGVEVAERFAYYGISSNLITYLTGPLGQSTADAAVNVNAWLGTASLLPLLGAFVADSFLGRYRTIVLASLLYILGLGLLTLSTVFPSSSASGCHVNKIIECSPDQTQVILFFISLYLVALAQGGHKPCVQAFGADQFDGQDPEECKAKSSFFNWWYFCMCGSTLLTVNIINYIEENVNWGLGFGIPCLSMGIALGIFLLGTKTYRYAIKGEEDNAFLRIGRGLIAAIRNSRTTPVVAVQEGTHGSLPHKSEQFKSLNKSLLTAKDLKEDTPMCTHEELQEAKTVLRLLPIWVICLVYAIVFAQFSTFFTKQGATMDRSIGTEFEIPAASLQSFISLASVLSVLIYDRVFVPIARSITGKPSGITMLQRIGIGMFSSAFSMSSAALVEMARLRIAREQGLVDLPNVTIPMSIWWLIPQYVFIGVGDVFTMVGLQEFFYDQFPSELKSMGLSLYLSIFGVGSFLSSFLVSAIDKTTAWDGHDSWFANNLNRGHLDYFYWLLAGLSMLQLFVFVYFSRSYVYNRGGGV